MCVICAKLTIKKKEDFDNVGVFIVFIVLYFELRFFSRILNRSYVAWGFRNTR